MNAVIEKFEHHVAKHVGDEKGSPREWAAVLGIALSSYQKMRYDFTPIPLYVALHIDTLMLLSHERFIELFQFRVEFYMKERKGRGWKFHKAKVLTKDKEDAEFENARISAARPVTKRKKKLIDVK